MQAYSDPKTGECQVSATKIATKVVWPGGYLVEWCLCAECVSEPVSALATEAEGE
jgi:hypothetical protein